MKPETAKYLVQKTINDYSKIAEDFSATRSFSWQIMQEFAQFVKPSDKILDFGCGNGRLLDVLKFDDIVYKGIDPVGGLVDIARQKYRDEAIRSIEFKVSDIDVDDFRLDFPDRYFDHIFSIAVFHHLPSKKLREDVLREFRRVLKDDGRVYLTVWNLWRGKYFMQTVKFFLRTIFGRIKDMGFGIVEDLDFGDLFVGYTTGDKQTKVQRYHHAFKIEELKSLAKRADFLDSEVFYDAKRFNICAVLRKNL